MENLTEITIFKKTDILKKNLNDVSFAINTYKDIPFTKLTQNDLDNIRTILSNKYKGRIGKRSEYIENKLRGVRICLREIL